MDHPARLPIDCPRCENRGVLALNDDRTIACLLCNNWCSLCLDGVPTFVPMTRPYRGSLIAGMRPTIDGERLFEGYACDYSAFFRCSAACTAPTVLFGGSYTHYWSNRRGDSPPNGRTSLFRENIAGAKA